MPNVNTVKQQTGSDGELSSLEFKMEDTVTAVDVTCAVQLDMVVMPKGFAKSTVDDGTYEITAQTTASSSQKLSGNHPPVHPSGPLACTA